MSRQVFINSVGLALDSNLLKPTDQNGLDKYFVSDDEGVNLSDLEAVEALANSAQTTANNAQTTANSAQTVADNAQTVANNAMPKTGGIFSGAVTFTELRINSPGITYEYNMRVTRGVAAANYQGTYKISDNNIVYWRNNIAGIEQKIILPLTTFGTTKVNVYNNPSPGNIGGILVMGNKVIDTGSEYNTANGRFTATIPGVYHLTAALFKNAATETKATFRKNGTAFGSGGSMPITTNHAMMEFSELVSLQAGDYIEVFVSAGTIVNDYPTNKFSAFIVI